MAQGLKVDLPFKYYLDNARRFNQMYTIHAGRLYTKGQPHILASAMREGDTELTVIVQGARLNEQSIVAAIQGTMSVPKDQRKWQEAHAPRDPLTATLTKTEAQLLNEILEIKRIVSLIWDRLS